MMSALGLSHMAFSVLEFIVYSILSMASLLFFFFFRATPVAYGNFQARGQIGAANASLHHNHSNAKS